MKNTLQIRMFIILILNLFITEIASSQTWQYVSKTKDDSKHYIYYKTEKSDYNLFPNSSTFKIWTKIEQKSYKHHNGVKNVTYPNVTIKLLYEINCDKSQLVIKQLAIYDSKDNIITSEMLVPDEASTVVPESIGAAVLNAACKLYSLESKN